MVNKSGIDIDLGNKCSQIAYNWAKKTFANRDELAGEMLKTTDGTFSNIIRFGNSRIGISSDGIGTKIELAERTNNYRTIGSDLLAMVTDDLVANGFEPTNISNILDVDFLDTDIVDELMHGLHDAAGFAKVSITGGEIAELGDRIGGYGEKMHFNWCSTAIGLLPDKLQKPIDGSDIEVGDEIISFRSRGFRSNGYSLIRTIMENNFGTNWHNQTYEEGTSWGEKLLTPSLIYAPLITALIEENLIPSGIAHITGGGIADNLGRVLKANKLGAELDTLHAPRRFMSEIQKIGNISETQAYSIWNMGNGMLITTNPDHTQDILLKASGMGYEAVVAGKAVSENTIKIRSMGIQPQDLVYQNTEN
jgi:phosphoribosylformylglycinamidine cyclo-ligase